MAVLYVGTAQAESLSSEYLLKALEKQSLLQVQLGNSTNSIYSGGKIGATGKVIDINYEYGINNNISFYGGVSHLDHTLEGTMSGLGPLVAGAKYAKNLGPGLIFGKLDISAGVLEGKMSCNNGCSASDSAIGMALQLAYQWMLGNANTGISVSHGLFSTDAKEKDGTEFEKDPILKIDLFYERGLGEDNLYGFVLSYMKDIGLFGSASYYPISGGGFHILKDSGLEADALALKGYLKTSLTESLNLLTSAEYSRAIGNDAFSSKTNTIYLNIGLRKHF